MIARFEHGGNVHLAAKQLGVSERALLDFSANINPLGTPQEVREVLQHSFWRLEHYPDPYNRDARESLAKHHGCDSEEIVLGNGAAELFGLLCLALKPRRVVAVEPTYSGYAFAAGLFGISYHPIIQNPEKKADFRDVSCQLKNGDLLFLCNPNNPTGHTYSREQIDVLVKACALKGAMLVLDESFYDFLPNGVAPQSYISEEHIPSHVVVVRSLTKILALPGLRLGYLRANSAQAEKIRSYRDPWSVNALALESACLYPQLVDYVQESQLVVQQENQYLRDKISEVTALRIVSGDVNFLLLSLWDGCSSTSLHRQLHAKGVLVRNCNNFPGMGEGYIRVAVRIHCDNDKLVEALVDASEILKAQQ